MQKRPLTPQTKDERLKKGAKVANDKEQVFPNAKRVFPKTVFPTEEWVFPKQ